MTLRRLLISAILGASALPGLSTAVIAHDDMDDPHDSAQLRLQAEQHSVYWRDERYPARANPSSWRHIKILGFNDFHGQLSVGKRVSNRPVGGAAVLASYLHAAQDEAQDGS